MVLVDLLFSLGSVFGWLVGENGQVSNVVGQDAQIINIQPRTVPSAVVAAGEEPPTSGYTNWHRDEGNGSGVFVHPLITTNVKLIVAVGEQHGGLEGSTVLPGTHRVHDMPASCV